MTCSGCIGLGCCGLVTVSSRCSDLERAGASPSSIAFVSWYDGTAPASPRYGATSSTSRRTSGAVRGREHVDERGDAPGVVAEVRRDQLRRVGCSSDARPRARRAMQHVVGLLAVGRALLGLDRLELSWSSAGGMRAAAGDEHEDRSCRAGRRGSGRCASTSPAVSLPTSRTTTTRCSVMNGGLAAAFSTAATADVARRRRRRRVGLVARAGAARDGELLEREACGRRRRAARRRGRRRRGRAAIGSSPFTR